MKAKREQEREKVNEKLETWRLSAASKAMNFFRCQSHLYPYV